MSSPMQVLAYGAAREHCDYARFEVICLNEYEKAGILVEPELKIATWNIFRAARARCVRKGRTVRRQRRPYSAQRAS